MKTNFTLFLYLAFFFAFFIYGCHLFYVEWTNFNGGFEDIWHLALFYAEELGMLFCFAFSFYIFDKMICYYERYF